MSHQDSLTQLDPLTPATKREGEGEEETGEAVGEAEAAATAGAEAEVAVVEGAVVVAEAGVEENPKPLNSAHMINYLTITTENVMQISE